MDKAGNLTNKMHLYLKKKGEQQRWLIIQLTEGHMPRVAGLSGEETNSLTDDIEPAIWFKVMVIESVTIDCEARFVCWSTGRTDESNSICRLI